jgi:ATP-dependent Lhr-like helicase
VPGGFAALYPVFAAMEEGRRIRRGYFVSGLGGSQFAEAGALERLRALRETAATPEEIDQGLLPALRARRSGSREPLRRGAAVAARRGRSAAAARPARTSCSSTARSRPT